MVGLLSADKGDPAYVYTLPGLNKNDLDFELLVKSKL
jgi:hypothetical protein